MIFRKSNFSRFEDIIGIIQNVKTPILANRDLGFNVNTNGKTWKIIADNIMIRF